MVKTVNGIPVKNLNHLVEILRDAKDEFITIECDSRFSETMVFPRAQMLAATDEILTDNGVRSQGSPDTLAVWNAKPCQVSGRKCRQEGGRISSSLALFWFRHILSPAMDDNSIFEPHLFQPLTGHVVTQPDGMSKSGMVVAIQKEFSLPVNFIGPGGPLDDLQPYAAKQFARALFEENHDAKRFAALASGV